MAEENAPPRRIAWRRTDKRGRSAGLSAKKNPKVGPGECGFEQFAWIPPELLLSPAWRALSVNARRLIDRLLIEHLGQGGVQNGELIVTHGDFDEYGLSRNRIADAIREVEFLGLVCVKRGPLLDGRRRPSLYRLTWMGGWSRAGEIIDPSNEWKGVSDDAIAEWRAKRRATTKTQRAFRAKNRSNPQK